MRKPASAPLTGIRPFDFTPSEGLPILLSNTFTCITSLYRSAPLWRLAANVAGIGLVTMIAAARLNSYLAAKSAEPLAIIQPSLFEPAPQSAASTIKARQITPQVVEAAVDPNPAPADRATGASQPAQPPEGEPDKPVVLP